MPTPDVLRLADIGREPVDALFAAWGLQLVLLPAGAAIRGSFWGDSEAGVVGTRVFARPDTPVHSLLHEAGHIICMDAERRRELDRDAGGDDLEEEAVCYLQVVLADRLPGVGRDRLFTDMDRWGYSFRLGSARRWFADDADAARDWLVGEGVLDAGGEPVTVLRGADDAGV